MPPDESTHPTGPTIHLDLIAHMQWSHAPADHDEYAMREQLEARLQLFVQFRKEAFVQHLAQEFGAWLVSEGQDD